MANFSFRDRDRFASEFIDDCVSQANRVRQQYENQWRENWSNYRVESAYNSQHPNKQYPLSSGGTSQFDVSPINFLKTPESHQGVNAIRALLMASLFGVRDYVQADPVGDEDIESAKRVSKLVMFGCERPGNFRTNWETIGDSVIFGLGSYTGRWKQIIRLVPRRVPVPDPINPDDFLRNPKSGSIMSVLKNVEVPVYDDPVIETDDLFDTWFDPSANRFDELKWKIKRFRIRDEELIGLMNDSNWDADGIAEVLQHKPGETRSGPDRSDHPKLLTENLSLEDVKDIDKFGYYSGWMFEGQVPKDVAEDIGGLDYRGSVIIRTINGIVIQTIQSPQRNGYIQGGVITVLPTGRGIYGLSPLTIVRYLQDVSDTQLILTVQALIESVYQNYLTSGDMGPNFARDLETRRPREVFTVQGEIEQVQPLPKDYTGLQIAMSSLGLISQTMRNAMNARDPVQGIMSQGGDTTATETNTVTQAALRNTDQLAMLIERDELPILGRVINDLYYVNLDDEAKVFRRVGESETTSVSYFDIDMVTDINFVGARNIMTKSQKANQFRDFAMMLASNPLTSAMTDWHEFVRRYGDEALDLKGLERLMLQDPEEIVARMQATGLGNALGSMAGQGGGAPPAKGRSVPGNGGRTGGVTETQNSGESS